MPLVGQFYIAGDSVPLALFENSRESQGKIGTTVVYRFSRRAFILGTKTNSAVCSLIKLVTNIDSLHVHILVYQKIIIALPLIATIVLCRYSFF